MAAKGDDPYLVVDLASRELAVRTRGVELEAWPLELGELLVVDRAPVELPMAAEMADWPLPRSRTFHVIPGLEERGQPTTAPSIPPAEWTVALAGEREWVLSVNRHRDLLSPQGRLLAAGRDALSRRRGSRAPLIALALSEADARGLYHLARPGIIVMVVEGRVEAPTIELPARPAAAAAPVVAEEQPSGPPVSAAYLLLLGGLIAAVAGGELLVRGAVRLATAAGLPALVIGLTVVAFGTSAPELAVTLRAAMAGAGDLGLGNVLGSNVFNLLAILGISGLLRVLVIHPDLVRRDVLAMIGASGLLLLLTLDGRLSRLDGAMLLALGVAYTAWLVIAPGPAELQDEGAESLPTGPRRRLIGFGVLGVAGGLVALVVGARWLVSGGVVVARSFGISELVIGLTIVAAGTSLPEVVTSVVATLRGQRDIAVGNVVGSNIFNILWVLGLAAVVGGGFAVEGAARSIDLPLVVAVAALCWPLLRSGHRLVRGDAVLLLAIYALYLAQLAGR